MAVHFHPHAKERMEERGATEREVILAVQDGERFPARFKRIGFRYNFPFEGKWRGKHYYTKQVEVYVIQEKDTDWLVLTVICRYF